MTTFQIIFYIISGRSQGSSSEGQLQQQQEQLDRQLRLEEQLRHEELTKRIVEQRLELIYMEEHLTHAATAKQLAAAYQFLNK